jgi:uncharacterized protein
MIEPAHVLTTLETRLDDAAPVVVAVSGGVDSMTLAVVAGRRLGDRARMVHARSPAVPAAATERVRRHAEAERWDLAVLDAGEFDDPRYRANPADRCFYCKSHLYETLARLRGGTVLSGTNTDDLGDYRPGLRAAADNAVRHPYVEAGIDKATVRAIARILELDDLSELPAAPCLSSRVETGIPIEALVLGAVDAAETLLRAALTPDTVRCRVRHGQIVVELDGATLAGLAGAQRDELGRRIAELFSSAGLTRPVDFEPYRMGSAFLRGVAGA